MNASTVGLTWTPGAADEALAQAIAERDRLASLLVALEDQPTWRLLEGATLSGLTAVRWTSAKQAQGSLWELFTAFSASVELAQQVRERRSRPDQNDLAEMMRLLAAEGVTPMDEVYAVIADLVATVERVWSTMLPLLDRIEQAKNTALVTAQELDQVKAAEIAALDLELGGVRESLIGDPLSLVHHGTIQTGQLDRTSAAIEGLVRDITRAVAIRNDFSARQVGLTALVREVEQTEANAAELRARVVSRISGVEIVAVPSEALALIERLHRVEELHSAGRWNELVSAVDALQAAAEEASRVAHLSIERIGAPLRLRDELRGRLAAYRAKATGIGLAEDATLTALYEQARDLLWSAPCVIADAVAAVERYQREVAGRNE